MKITNAAPLQPPDTNSTVSIPSNADPKALSPQDLQANLNQGIAKAMNDIDQILAAGQNSQEQDERSNLQLQSAMDRRSKLEETLSNVLKKDEDTADSLTRNLK